MSIESRKSRQFITTTEAMKMASVTRPTIIAWCEKYGIGNKVAHTWRINSEKLNKLLTEKQW